MLEEILILIGATIATLLPIANPFSTAPVFATLSKRFSAKRRKQQARMAVINMSAVLLVTLFGGALILTFFGGSATLFPRVSAWGWPKGLVVETYPLVRML